jgi:hypothetical protein
MLITVLTSWARLIQLTLTKLISLRSIYIIFPSTFSSSEWSLHAFKPIYCTHFSSSHACYITRLTYPSVHNYPLKVCGRVQIMKLLVVQLSRSSVISSLLTSDILLGICGRWRDRIWRETRHPEFWFLFCVNPSAKCRYITLRLKVFHDSRNCLGLYIHDCSPILLEITQALKLTEYRYVIQEFSESVSKGLY